VTDKEALIELFDKFGIGYRDIGNVITCHYGDDKVDGYPEQYVAFDFDKDGGFEEMGVW